MIGFGDLDFAASNRPAITTVSVDRHAIGEQAATLLADRIEGGEEGEAIIDIGFHRWRASRRSSAVSHVRGASIAAWRNQIYTAKLLNPSPLCS